MNKVRHTHNESLQYLISSITVFLAISLLSGCTLTKGSNFHYSKSDFIPSKTTESEVIAKLGLPYEQIEATSHDKIQKKLRYFYYDPYEGTVYPYSPARRSLIVSFKNKILIGEDFISTFMQDSTDFDFTNVTLLRIGVTTRNEAISLFGDAKAEYTKDLVSPTGLSVGATHGLLYKFYFFDYHIGFYVKKFLTIELNDSNIVVNVIAEKRIDNTINMGKKIENSFSKFLPIDLPVYSHHE